MIVLGYNGFSRAADLYARIYGFTPEGQDRHNFRGHDAAAALFIDGVLVAAVEEERLNRQKKTSRFPINAMNWCLGAAGLGFADVDRYAFGWSFSDEFTDAAIREVASSGTPPAAKFRSLSSLGLLHTALFSRSALLEDFARSTGYELPDEKLVMVPHHLAHLACGRLFAGVGDAGFIINDGQAELDSSIMGEVRGGEVKVLESFTISASSSIAQLYGVVTRYLGFVPNIDEYKVMGLAGFARPPAPAENPLLREVVRLEPHGRYSLALSGRTSGYGEYQPLLDRLFDSGDREDFDVRARVAAAAQQMIEVVTAHQLRALADKTDLRDLIFEGGLALNCVNNSKLLAELGFNRVEVSFGASDPGVSIGAAAYAAAELGDPPQPSSSPYLGPEYDNEQIREVLTEHRESLDWQELPTDQIVAQAVRMLAGKNVIGWFQGRTEYGPRALGNRSILANPSFPEMKDIINSRVKHREPFRPFAPIVLEEDSAQVFRMGKKTRSQYMTFVFPVQSGYADRVAAATHVDGSSRVQTVSDQGNPLLAWLLREFKAYTGVPCLVNTSFNVAGSPIVCAPADAVACFLATDIDHLVIGNFLVSKSHQRSADLATDRKDL